MRNVVVKDSYHSQLNESTVISQGSTVATTSGEWTKIGELTVGAGQAYALGFGQLRGQEDAVGRFYFDLKDSSASPGVNLDGLVRIRLLDPNDREIKTLWEGRTETLRTSATDRRQQVPLSEISPAGRRDKKLVFEYKSDAGGTVGRANSSAFLSVTKYLVD